MIISFWLLKYFISIKNYEVICECYLISNYYNIIKSPKIIYTKNKYSYLNNYNIIPNMPLILKIYDDNIVIKNK